MKCWNHFENLDKSESNGIKNKTQWSYDAVDVSICLNLYENSTGRKYSIFCFAQYLLQILVKCQNHGQFWNLHVLRIPKLSLKVKFDQDLAEKIKVRVQVQKNV